jgi:hypothetical protein
VADHARAAGAIHDVTGWPSSFSRRLPMMRAVASVPPPAPPGNDQGDGALGIGGESKVLASEETRARRRRARKALARMMSP